MCGGRRLKENKDKEKNELQDRLWNDYKVLIFNTRNTLKN